MTAIEKFTFALSFDDADNVIRSSGADDEHYDVGKKKKKEEEEAPPPPPPAIYTEEQAAQMVADAENAAREQALAEGHAQGLEQGRQEILASLEKAAADCQAIIGEKLSQIDEQQKRANAQINEDAIHVALGVIRKLAPAWSKKYELTEIEDIVRQCLANLFEAPKVIVKVHPELEQKISESAQQIAESRGFSGNVIVIGEPEVARGDCMVSWGDGTAVRDSGRVWSEVNAIVDGALDLHRAEYDLPQSDMGDPDVQQTRLPDEEQAAESATATAAADERIEDDQGASTAHERQNGQESADTAQNVTSDTDAQTKPSAPSEDHVKEGDGTHPQNVQTSPDDVMQTSDLASEMPVDDAKKSAPTSGHTAQESDSEFEDASDDAQDGETQNVNEDAANTIDNGDSGTAQVQSPDTTEPTDPHSVRPTPGTSAGQDENRDHGSTPNPPQADDPDAVKQPPKDAGD